MRLTRRYGSKSPSLSIGVGPRTAKHFERQHHIPLLAHSRLPVPEGTSTFNRRAALLCGSSADLHVIECNEIFYPNSY